MSATKPQGESGAPAGDRQTHGFQAEVRELLKLMIHSLYSHREIFLRELISNASDACDRLRFAAIADSALLADDPEFGIRIDADPAAATVTITDNGIGMSREETIANLGTIARSGTAEFFRSLSGDEQKAQSSSASSASASIPHSWSPIASRCARAAGAPTEAGVQWESDGKGNSPSRRVTKQSRGTDVILHLKGDAREFADPMRLRGLIRRYSDFVGFPSACGRRARQHEDEAVNREGDLAAAANQITEEEYRQFYKYLSHDFTDPPAGATTRWRASASTGPALPSGAGAVRPVSARGGARAAAVYSPRIHHG